MNEKTKNLIACMTDEAVLSWYADTYGTNFFTAESVQEQELLITLKEEILNRMKKAA